VNFLVRGEEGEGGFKEGEMIVKLAGDGERAFAFTKLQMSEKAACASPSVSGPSQTSTPAARW
jgi:hypothetical protein